MKYFITYKHAYIYHIKYTQKNNIVSHNIKKKKKICKKKSLFSFIFQLIFHFISFRFLCVLNLVVVVVVFFYSTTKKNIIVHSFVCYIVFFCSQLYFLPTTTKLKEILLQQQYFKVVSLVIFCEISFEKIEKQFMIYK